MQSQFVTKPAFTVVGVLIHTKPMAREIPILWRQFGLRMDEVQLVAEPGVSYGLMDQPAEAPDQLDYMAGAAVVEAVDLPAGMTSWHVPTAAYAVFQTTLSGIGDTFGYIHDLWLPGSGYQQAATPYFERYPATFTPDDPTSTFSIYIPVEKKG